MPRPASPITGTLKLVNRQLKFYRKTAPDPARPGRYHYSEVTITPASGQASPLARPDVVVNVQDLLP